MKMAEAKSDKLKSRNLELVRTYYSGKKPSGKNEFVSKKLLIFIVFLLLVIGVSYFLIAARPLRYGEGTVLSPFKFGADISYYDYAKIKNNNVPIRLSRENACIAVQFKEIEDLTNPDILFAAKGQGGSEKIAIILKDNRNLSNANKNDIILTPLLSKDKWQAFSIKLKNMDLPLNKNKITQLRFDISENFTKNTPDAVVYIKKISIK